MEEVTLETGSRLAKGKGESYLFHSPLSLVKEKDKLNWATKVFLSLENHKEEKEHVLSSEKSNEVNCRNHKVCLLQEALMFPDLRAVSPQS